MSNGHNSSLFMICAFSNSAETVPWAREMLYFPLTVLLSNFVDYLSSEKILLQISLGLFPRCYLFNINKVV